MVSEYDPQSNPDVPVAPISNIEKEPVVVALHKYSLEENVQSTDSATLEVPLCLEQCEAFQTFRKVNNVERSYLAANLMDRHGFIETGDCFDEDLLFVACSVHTSVDIEMILVLHFISLEYLLGVEFSARE